MRALKVAVVMSSVLAALAGCSSTPKSVEAPAQPATNATANAGSQQGSTAGTATSTVTPVSLPEYLDPNSALSKNRSVYFDFDDFSIKPEYTSLVEQHGKFLAAHPDVSIKIEGNADERGSAEYNLALGQKRAESVGKALKVLGAQPKQIEAVSFGEEKPLDKGHDEAAWAKNRRADIVYPAK
ncbi:MAG TPA: peptidoglycan-associated lipoprotein Pal [Aquabacterium sp.]|nr:peptidoglycan-associated lipoprotein Pal [Aquabacterium sp.]